MKVNSGQDCPPAEIMVVEDDIDSLRLLSSILTDAGYHVRPAVDGKLAIRSVQAKSPDLILLDIKLPEIDGVEVCRRIKADPDTRKIPVIFISALMETDMKVKALETGGVDYVTKPIEPSEVLIRISTHLNIYRLQRRLAARSRELTAEIEVRQRTEMELKKHRRDLEKRVAERTAALKQSEERYRSIVKTAMDGYWLTDTKGRLLEVNETYCKMSGYREDELLDMHITDLEIAESAELVAEHMQKVVRMGQDRFESKHLRKNGTIFDVEVSVQHRPAEGGQCICFLRDITEQKRAAEKIAELNQRFAIAADAGCIGVWDLDIENDILHWNDWMYRIYGVDPNAFKGVYDAWKKGVHPHDLTRADAEVKTAMNQGKPLNTTFRIMRPGGEIRHIKAYGRVTYNLHGKPVKMTGINIDITDQTHSEAALKESETKFRTLVNQAPAALFLHDMDGRIVDVNKATMDGYGYTLQQLLGMKAKDIDPNYTKLEDQDKFWEELKAKKRIDFETHHRRSDGSRFPVRVSLTPITLSNRNHIFALAVDMTEYKNAQEKLNISEERFRTVFDQAAVGVALVSKDGFFLELNDKFCEIVGYTKNDLYKKTFRDITHPDDLVLDENFVDKVIAQEMDSFEIEKRYIHKNGHPVWIRLYSSVVRKIGGNIKYAVAVVTDISKQKIAEEERRKLLNQLNQAQRMESIGNLAGGIAHDFNNILFPIIGMSEMLMEDLPPNSPEWENAEEIFKAGNRGRDLVRQILAFSRQSEHKLIPSRIQHVLKEVLKLARSSIPSYIQINQDIQQDCGMVKADPTQIHQVAMNIITNAYHVLEDTGGKISVRLKETSLEASEAQSMHLRPGKYAVLSISDTGHGMPPDLIEKIFDPYFTTKEKERGTGLGLAVVHGIVKEHNGHVQVLSEIAKGTTFNVYIPLLERSFEAGLAKKAEEDPTGNERILIVDDEETIARLEKQMLERLGYSATIRINSLEAFELFKTKPDFFDLVLSDMTMPDMTGDQLAREIQAVRPDIPIIICTGFSERLNPEKAESIGVKGFLMKPIVKAELAKMVRKVLDEVKF